MEIGLTGSVTIVTGAGRGLGAAVVERFQQEGAVVYALDLAQEQRIDGATFLQTDVTSEADVEASVAEVISRSKRIDALVNCAAVIGPIGNIHDITVEEWRRTLDVNLTGTFIACRAVLPVMLAQKKGRIVNFASGSGVVNNSGQAPYNASKAAVISLTKTVAQDVYPHGVGINAICPGNVDTPLMESFFQQDVSTLSPEVQKNQRFHHQMAKEGLIWQPHEVMDLIVFLASAASNHVSGQFIRMATKYDPGA